jgi:transcription-repair coupling factor (superfamily II helicase)
VATSIGIRDSVQLLRGGGKGDASKVKEQLKSGECEVVVGTHALLQPTVTFGNLGLLVIDEEQRFGVAHKEKLKAVSSGTDVLTLSATPIPRTLQMSLTGLRDLSLMTTPPKGRKEVKVYVDLDRDELIEEAVRRELQRQGQIFVVVPFVQSVGPTRERLLNMMPDIRVIEAHGQHPDLEDRIDAFSAGQVSCHCLLSTACSVVPLPILFHAITTMSSQADVLVATTVIENGVDMPNVNTIIVLNADRYSQTVLAFFCVMFHV